MDMTDWLSTDDIARLAAEELNSALDRVGVQPLDVYVNGDDRVAVTFGDIRDAETMMSLGVPADARPRTLYDRSTGACVSVGYEVTRAAAEGGEADTESLERAKDASWFWSVHPDMSGRRMDWHVSVDMAAEDATAVAANLNAVWRVQP